MRRHLAFNFMVSITGWSWLAGLSRMLVCLLQICSMGWSVVRSGSKEVALKNQPFFKISRKLWQTFESIRSWGNPWKILEVWALFSQKHTQVSIVQSQFNPSNSTDSDRASQRMQTTFAFFHTSFAWIFIFLFKRYFIFWDARYYLLLNPQAVCCLRKSKKNRDWSFLVIFFLIAFLWLHTVVQIWEMLVCCWVWYGEKLKFQFYGDFVIGDVVFTLSMISEVLVFFVWGVPLTFPHPFWVDPDRHGLHFCQGLSFVVILSHFLVTLKLWVAELFYSDLQESDVSFAKNLDFVQLGQYREHAFV